MKAFIPRVPARRPMRTLLLAALLLLAPPPAAAQVPGQPQPCGPINVLDPVVPAALAPGTDGDVTLSVQNAGNVAADVTVAGSTTSVGWSIVTAAEQTVRVAPGGSTDFTFRVRPEASAGGDGAFNFATTASCVYPGANTCPAISPQLCQAQGPARTAAVALAPQPGFRIPGLDDLAIPPAYLVAGILLLGGAIAVPLLLRRKKPRRATATCPEPLKPVRPGKGTSFPIEVSNPSDGARRLHLEVGPVPEGWSAFLPLPEIQLAAKETRSLWLMVRAPPAANVGESADVEVTATDAARPERPTVVKVRAEVEPEPAGG